MAPAPTPTPVSPLVLTPNDRELLTHLKDALSTRTGYEPLKKALEQLLKDPQNLSLKEQALLISENRELFLKVIEQLALNNAQLRLLLTKVVDWSDKIIKELKPGGPSGPAPQNTPITTTQLHTPPDTRLARLEHAIILVETTPQRAEDLTAQALNQIATAVAHKHEEEKVVAFEARAAKEREDERTESEMRAIDLQDGYENMEMSSIKAQLEGPYGSREVALRQIREAQLREAEARNRGKAA